MLIDGFKSGSDQTITITNGSGQVIEVDCQEVTTSLRPTQSNGGLALVKVTHGGQLGAPYAQKDCGEILDNPCIRGQWEHVRHYQGQGNPRDTVSGFHSGQSQGRV